MKTASLELNSATENMNEVSAKISEVGDHLAGTITNVIDSTEKLATENQQNREQMSLLHTQLL